MDEKNIGEQPEILDSNSQSTIVENENLGDGVEQKQEGSLGKFKDAESLLNAYNNLQAEFTKKCQKLSELEKAKEEQNLDSQKVERAEQKLVFEEENWKQNVSAFLKENTEAKEYAGAICNEILNDQNLKNSPYALELAWARVMQREFKNPSTLAVDQNFINEKILSQEQVKMQVLNEYFKNLQNTKTPPVISASGSVAGITVKQPTNLTEAKQMVEKLFNIKG